MSCEKVLNQACSRSSDDEPFEEFDELYNDIRTKKLASSRRKGEGLPSPPAAILNDDVKIKLALRTSRSTIPGAMHASAPSAGQRRIEAKPSQEEQLSRFASQRRADMKMHHVSRGPGRHKHEEMNLDFTNNSTAQQDALDDSQRGMIDFQRETNVLAEVDRQKKRRRSRIAFCCVGVAVVVVALSIGLAIGLMPKSISEEDHPAVAQSFDVARCYLTDQEETERYVMVLSSILATYPDVSDAATTPGSLAWSALCWVAHFDIFETHLTQRFALAVIYFHFVGTNLSISNRLSRSNWLSEVHFCEWENVECDVVDGYNEVNRLTLSHASLRGNIPSELALLTKLSILEFTGNGLTGSIPSEILAMTQLHELFFAYNLLTGTISREIRNLPQLRLLHLTANRFTGTFPDVSEMPSLVSLNLESNFFEGPLPNFTSLTNLELFITGGNYCTGTFPSNLKNLSKLEQLMVRNPDVSGPFPSEIGSLTQLYRLLMGPMALTGTLPTDLGRLSVLQHLDLDAMTQLKGTVPSELGLLTHLTFLSFSGMTGLKGSIPSEVCDLRSNKLKTLTGWCVNCPSLCPAQ